MSDLVPVRRAAALIPTRPVPDTVARRRPSPRPRPVEDVEQYPPVGSGWHVLAIVGLQLLLVGVAIGWWLS